MLYVCRSQHLEFVCERWVVGSVFSVVIFGFDLRKKGGWRRAGDHITVSYLQDALMKNLQFLPYTYRVFHDLCTLLQEVISYVFVIKKVHINMCPILDGYGVMGIF